MAPQDFRTCPACGTRNKVKWELCVRCGQSLTDVPVGAPVTPSTTPVEGLQDSGSGLLWPVVGSVVVLIAAVGIWKSGWTLDTAKPNGATFTFATVPPALPSPVAVDNSSTAAKFAEAQRRAGARDFDGAMPLFEAVVREAPQDARYHSGFGQALWDAGRRDEALGQMREAAQTTEDPYRIMFARRLVEAGRPQDAIREYDAALRARPNDAAIAAELGNVLNATGDYAKAAEVFRTAVAGSQNAELRASFALALEKTGNAREAIDVYRRLLGDNGNYTLVRARLADLMAGQGDVDGAVKLYQEGLQRDPSAVLLHQGLGATYEKQRRWKEAASEYRESVRLAPNGPNAKTLADRANEIEKLGG